MKKFFSLVAALLAVSLVSFGFVACSDDDDDDDGPSVVARYAATMSEGGVSYPLKLTMYSDKTWTYSVTAEGYTSISYKRTYETKSGDWANGSVEMTITHEMNDGGSLVAYDSTNEDAKKEYTITNGEFTFMSAGFKKQ